MNVDYICSTYETNAKQANAYMQTPLKGAVAHPKKVGNDIFMALCDSSGSIQVKIEKSLPNWDELLKLKEYDKVSVVGTLEMTGTNRLQINASEVKILT